MNRPYQLRDILLQVATPAAVDPASPVVTKVMIGGQMSIEPRS